MSCWRASRAGKCNLLDCVLRFNPALQRLLEGRLEELTGSRPTNGCDTLGVQNEHASGALEGVVQGDRRQINRASAYTQGFPPSPPGGGCPTPAATVDWRRAAVGSPSGARRFQHPADEARVAADGSWGGRGTGGREGGEAGCMPP